MAENVDSAYLQEWDGSDAVLVVGDTRLHVHSQILSLASPVFRVMFASGFKEGLTKTVHLPGKETTNVINLLNLVYPTKHGITDSTNCKALLELAREYDMARIFNLVDDYMSVFTPKNVETLKLAEQYKLNRTKSGCIIVLVKSKDDQVFRSETFRSLKSSTRLCILEGKIRLMLTAFDKRCSSNVDESPSQTLLQLNESMSMLRASLE